MRFSCAPSGILFSSVTGFSTTRRIEAFIMSDGSLSTWVVCTVSDQAWLAPANVATDKRHFNNCKGRIAPGPIIFELLLVFLEIRSETTLAFAPLESAESW